LPALAWPSGQRATPRPSWLRSRMETVLGDWSSRATWRKAAGWPAIVADDDSVPPPCPSPFAQRRGRPGGGASSTQQRAFLPSPLLRLLRKGGREAYFCFQLPPCWYHQPGRALLIHCLANTSRIWLSHSGWPLATATSR